MKPKIMVRRRAVAVTVGVLAVGVGGALPASAGAGPCVGGPGCAIDLQSAIDAAPQGSTIRVAPGTYRGGVTITKSLTLAGAGAARTVVRGGGPVVTVSTSAGVRPTVVIDGLTLAGGLTHSNAGVDAFGGGLWVPPGPEDTAGATVSLRDVVVSGNRTEPTGTVPSPTGKTCPDGPCPYALSAGAGIASFGDLSLERSLVTGNRAGGRTSDTEGGGIFVAGSRLTVRSSVVRGNVSAPQEIGRFAEAGGIFAASATTTIEDSAIDGNRAVLETSWPLKGQNGVIDMLANGGGIHIAHGGTLTVTDSRIDGNGVVADDPQAEPYSFGYGLLADDGATVTLTRTSISRNRLDVRAVSSEDVGNSGGAVEIDAAGTLTDVRITDNSASVRTGSGLAFAQGALAGYGDNPQRLVLDRVVIKGNQTLARSASGDALAVGGGIVDNALMTVKDSLVQGNTVTASAPGGTATAQGGGVVAGPVLFESGIELAMSGSRVTGNAAIAQPSGTARGGGILALVPVTLDRTVVAGNRPDQCAGCTASRATAKAAPTRPLAVDAAPRRSRG